MTEAQPAGVIAATLVVYMLGLLGIGWWARGRTSDDDSFFIGGRRLGAVVASMSYAAGSSSAWSILGVSGIAYSQGLSAVWLLPGTLTGHLLAWFWLGRRLNEGAHAHRWVTLNDLVVQGVEGQARRRLLIIAASVIACSFLFYVAAQLQGAANTFAEVFGMTEVIALLLGAAVVLVYTMLGGFWAVSVTDALQALLMLFAALVLPLAALDAVGGISGLVMGLEASGAASSLTSGYEGMFAVGFLVGMLSIGLGPLGQPHLLNRIMALRDRASLQTARVIALIWFVVVLGGMFVAGLCAHELLANASVDDPERLFFRLNQQLLPPVVAGVLIAAVLAAIMSTADSQLLVAASAVSRDLLQRSSLTVSRLAVGSVGILAVVVALALPEAIFSRVLFAWNALGAAFGPVVIARLLKWSVPPSSVGWAMLLGFGLTVVFYLAPDAPGDLAERGLPFLIAFIWLVLAKRRSRPDI